MDTATLKKFAQSARNRLQQQVADKLELVLAPESPARREQPQAMKALVTELNTTPREQLIEKVAYTWFNRFCALRFMDANRYTRVCVLSPLPGQTQPEILAEAKMGHIDPDMVPENTRNLIFALLNGDHPSPDPQAEAYRLLLVAACNYWHRAMPFLFELINDYTELLLPDDLLSDSSLPTLTCTAMTPETCRDVEVIGWLYQFYIAEKKEQVFAGLKKNKKITPENIPAATQLFTPHWIVKYLVENSLGRLWMMNRPDSKLVDRMDYYIEAVESGECEVDSKSNSAHDPLPTTHLKISSPEEIRICDPACGSGHMLTYAFDLLYAIYAEEGYSPTEIPEKILTRNLYGIEIDTRAGDLAAFALAMKAQQYDKRFLRKQLRRNGSEPITPHICVLHNIVFDDSEIDEYMNAVGRDLFTAPLQTTLRQFEEADNLGSLIRPALTDVDGIRRELATKDIANNLFLNPIHQKVQQALEQADYLSPQYHVVLANPPYMEISGANGRLKSWALDSYPESSSNLFAMFMVRGLLLSKELGMLAMINMQAWMFLSSFNRLREKVVKKHTILSMAHLGEKAFDSIGGDVVSTTAFVIQNRKSPHHKGEFLRLVSGTSEAQKAEIFRSSIKTNDKRYYFRAEPIDFEMISGSPISYWVSNQLRKIFKESPTLKTVAKPRKGMVTADNPRFIRVWHEVSYKTMGIGLDSRDTAKLSARKWFPYLKGGPFRRWYGNIEHVVNWENDGFELLNMKGNGYKVGSTNHNLEFIFKPVITWTKITSGLVSFRSTEYGFLFDDASGLCPVSEFNIQPKITGLLNSPVVYAALGALNPTLNVNPGNLSDIPVILAAGASELAKNCIDLSKNDWDAYETSWDFTALPLLQAEYRQSTLAATYQKIRAHWREMTLEMQQLEEENNRIFIDAYGLQDELTPEVPLNEITLTCNPHYRYKGNKSEAELETLLRADTIKEFLSYAVGCMFGRYALDKPGLVLANQGETLADYLQQIPAPRFPADDDNVITILEDAWFTDDMTERFYAFLRVTFGEDLFADNLQFIEDALGKSVRAYFLKDFYKDHVRRYKKRPIYWLFSSPKGSFNALIYLHRYRPDTVSVILNGYLREYREKLRARAAQLDLLSNSTDASAGEKTKALKELTKIRKVLDEINDYERDILFPLATKNLEIDLDDGVKVNYPKFGKALKKIPGLGS